MASPLAETDKVIDDLNDQLVELTEACTRARSGKYSYPGLVPASLILRILGGETCNQAELVLNYVPPDGYIGYRYV